MGMIQLSPRISVQRWANEVGAKNAGNKTDIACREFRNNNESD